MAAGNPMVGYDFVDDIVLVVTGDEAVPDALWNDFVRALDTFLTGRRAARYLIVTDGSNISTAQRQRLTETIKRRSGKPGPTAIIATSIVVRGIVTAINWLLGTNNRIFAPDSLDLAFDHMGVPHEDRACIEAKARALASRFGVRCLERGGSDPKAAQG